MLRDTHAPPLMLRGVALLRDAVPEVSTVCFPGNSSQGPDFAGHRPPLRSAVTVFCVPAVGPVLIPPSSFASISSLAIGDQTASPESPYKS